MLRITIPEPCHEKWDQMTPVDKGVFCGSCKKTVVDFSGMSDKEILDQLAVQEFQPSCGRFRASQLNRPLIYISPDVLTMNIPLWKKFLAAVFICFSGFLAGCSNSTENSVTEAIPPIATHPQIETIATVQETKDPDCEVKPKKKSSKKKNKKNDFSEIVFDGKLILGGMGPTLKSNPNAAPVIFPTAPNVLPKHQ